MLRSLVRFQLAPLDVFPGRRPGRRSFGRPDSGFIPRLSRVTVVTTPLTSVFVAEEVPAEFVGRPPVSRRGRLGVDVEERGGPLVPHPDLGGLDVDAQSDHGCGIGRAEGVKGESLVSRRLQGRDPDTLSPVRECSSRPSVATNT